MNQLDLNGRNAVVTGGASGLGFAIAERLVASGARVVIWDLNGEAAQAAGKKLGASSIAADVSDPTSIGVAVQKTLGIVPAIDILINNAGISGPNVKLWEYPIEDWKKNLRGECRGRILLLPGGRAADARAKLRSYR